MYKIIAIDADGTLLNKETLIPEENKKALLRAQREGVHIALCSGRSIVSLDKFADEIGLDPANSHIISFNGGAVFNGYGEQIREVRMEKQLTSYILKHILPFKRVTIAYYETDKLFAQLSGAGREEYDFYYSKSFVDTVFSDSLEKDITHEIYKVLLVGENNKLQEVEKHMLNKARDMEYSMYFSSPRLIEFASIHSTKAAGLDFVCKRLGFDMTRDAIAIGDSYNDLSMVQKAAFGVCMANGEDMVKSAADYITKRDNDNCGVAEVLEKFVFKQFI